MTRGVTRAGALLLVVGLAACAAPPAERLAGPVPPPLPDAGAPCPPVPEPVRDLQVQPFYTDASHSIVDPARQAAEREGSRPLELLLRRVERPSPPRCALAALDAWARADALLGSFSPQGAYRRKWTLAGLAIAFIGLRDAPGLDPAAKARVAAWLHNVAEAVRPYYDRPPGTGITDRLNNHLYWAGLAVAATGVASGDRAMLEWGIERARTGLRLVTAEGTLPLELARRRQALNYHLFSLQPLAAVAWLARANRVALGDAEGSALDRLVRFTVAAVQDTGRLTPLAGEPPEERPASHPYWADAGGVEIWLALHPDPAIEALLAPHRPLRQAWLGGDVAEVWRWR